VCWPHGPLRCCQVGGGTIIEYLRSPSKKNLGGGGRALPPRGGKKTHELLKRGRGAGKSFEREGRTGPIEGEGGGPNEQNRNRAAGKTRKARFFFEQELWHWENTAQENGYVNLNEAVKRGGRIEEICFLGRKIRLIPEPARGGNPRSNPESSQPEGGIMEKW